MVNRLFVVQHAYELPNGEDEVKFVGVYSSEIRAQEAVHRLSNLSGFRDHPDGFHIDPYEIDKDYWTEGFDH
jgi:hypothetical protein